MNSVFESLARRDPESGLSGWELLRKQKLWLIEQGGDEAEGLLNFIDSIQDSAVDEYGYSEEVVFGPRSDDN